MERPLEIAFHGVQSSPSIEAELREYVSKLETRFGRLLIGCRVSVEALHRQHQTGNLYEVHVVLSVPGRDLAVSREPQKARERYARPDLRTAIRDAFKAAERQLMGFKEQLREDTTAPSGSSLTGQVTLIEPGQDHGFILTSTGSQLYFHRDSVTNGRFEDLRQGDPVTYVEEEGNAGPTATKVRVVAG
ncbi:HPF/RaiA family ribosome-associated protein [Rhodovastum atsumiense]|uniref:HPF/RaiA family ribosome-associated protein n=1 Tax=Rhodovastum atsumiense TaxID=504468 RepID=A0A5M6IVZ0_9PROT|nr:HPF/RaiA family ribosome-associated protein [Rhodovastum atsumiense]KAA5612486.1 HPF/RaiA family ribosome-associated protein [Rhodovastum atsumiense]CAH2600405.1 HPF/RaiA family ribosome-associated protein [Rhodovastum atsumiense]